ncbi:hypothetical protein [Nocardioides aquiterrae]|uniref:ParB/Sulfiredoxin domain-containing protein n=1 Tax=Nocardioides aquiterrae TaxID=203799 RepID=A0ABP4EWF6_9ACTN
MGDITVPVTKLLLDELNPRHRAVTTQEQALHEVIRRAPIKLLNLARDIADFGLSPIDRPVVMKHEDGKRFIVLEGNRRLAALRLLKKPSLCPDPGLALKFKAAADAAVVPTTTVRCFEVATRDEARPILARRHGGEMDGIGVVRWSAMQRTRHASSPGHQERMALTTLDWLDGKSALGANQHLADLLDEVAEEKFTTFGRLAGDPDFRAYAGFDIKGDIFTPTDSSENIVSRLTLVLEDFKGGPTTQALTVSALKSKSQREEYVSGLREQMAGADEADEDEADAGETVVGDEPDETDGDSGGGPSNPPSPPPAPPPPPPPPPPPMRLFHGASLSRCSVRVKSVLHEVQTIPINKYPNSAAALIRMVIELAVMEAHDVCAFPPPPEKDKNLRAYVRNALKQLDPTEKAARYLALRQEIGKKDSLVNTATLNAFLHSSTYMPSAPTMRTISDTYTTLLIDLNKAIGDAKDAGT